MVNNEQFIKRLERILSYYGLSASAFADRIGVQRSSISHLLTGRNKPSLEFVLKVVRTFPEVNLYWLLNGKGSFPSKTANVAEATTPADTHDKTEEGGKKIRKIIIFYEDGSFEAYDGQRKPDGLI